MLQDKLLKYDIEVLTSFFETQVLGSSVEQPGVYSFTSTRGLDANGEFAKRMACSLRRLPGIAEEVEAPPYEDPLGDRGAFLPKGEAYSGLLGRNINSADIKVDEDTLTRYQIHTNNLLGGLDKTLRNSTGMYPGLGDITSVLNALDKASPLDLDILSSMKDPMVFELSKNEASELIGAVPISMVNGFFKSEPTCGMESAVASSLAEPVLGKLSDMLSEDVYSSRKPTVPLREMVSTTSVTAVALAGMLKKDTLKMMDILGKTMDTPTKPQEKLANNFIMSKIVQAKSSQQSGQLNMNFPIPFGNVGINGNNAAVRMDPLPQPSKKITELASRVNNPDLDTIKNVLERRAGKTVIIEL